MPDCVRLHWFRASTMTGSLPKLTFGSQVTRNSLGLSGKLVHADTRLDTPLQIFPFAEWSNLPQHGPDLLRGRDPLVRALPGDRQTNHCFILHQSLISMSGCCYIETLSIWVRGKLTDHISVLYANSARGASTPWSNNASGLLSSNPN